MNLLFSLRMIFCVFLLFIHMECTFVIGKRTTFSLGQYRSSSMKDGLINYQPITITVTERERGERKLARLFLSFIWLWYMLAWSYTQQRKAEALNNWKELNKRNFWKLRFQCWRWCSCTTWFHCTPHTNITSNFWIVKLIIGTTFFIYASVAIQSTGITYENSFHIGNTAISLDVWSE